MLVSCLSETDTKENDNIEETQHTEDGLRCKPEGEGEDLLVSTNIICFTQWF